MGYFIKLQVTNPDDYGVDYFAIESLELGNQNKPTWAVRAWDERGQSELEGPFSTREEAERVLCDNADYLDWCGYSVPVSIK